MEPVAVKTPLEGYRAVYELACAELESALENADFDAALDAANRMEFAYGEVQRIESEDFEVFDLDFDDMQEDEDEGYEYDRYADADADEIEVESVDYLKSGVMRNGLWYPDDGPWVEYEGTISQIPGKGSAVEVLLRHERRGQYFCSDVHDVDKFEWGQCGLRNDIVAYKVVNAAKVEEKPWYPDDSGEWIEHDGSPECPVDPETLVDVLFNGDRRARSEDPYGCTKGRPAGDWAWYHDKSDPTFATCHALIVAYKIVDPAKTEEKPWYPDDSGEWIEYSGGGMPVDGKTKVDIVLRKHRTGDRIYNSYWQDKGASRWDWSIEDVDGDIVAYKIVGPAKDEEKPWYPDDSGEWIEHDGSKCPVPRDTLVHVMLGYERTNAEFAGGEPSMAGGWFWDVPLSLTGAIVAYKIVGPAKVKEKPWYPDGRPWIECDGETIPDELKRIGRFSFLRRYEREQKQFIELTMRSPLPHWVSSEQFMHQGKASDIVAVLPLG